MNELRRKRDRNHLGRMSTRRFSADDAEAPSSSTDNDAVVSDVDSNFKISPKIRPVTFKPNRVTRKRLWSSKASFSSWQPSEKRKLLGKALSCPSTETDEEESDSTKHPGSSADEIEDPKNLSEISSPTPSDLSSSSYNKNSSFSESSPTASGSVNRRTRVLFQKKNRRKLSTVSSPLSDTPPEVTNDSSKSTKSVFAEVTKEIDSDVTSKEKVSSPNSPKENDAVINGVDSIPGKYKTSQVLSFEF